jgi:hypothetical protein
MKVCSLLQRLPPAECEAQTGQSHSLPTPAGFLRLSSAVAREYKEAETLRCTASCQNTT